MKAAIVGPLQSGKSTIAAGLTGKAICSGGSGAIQEVTVPVRDSRVDWLAAHFRRAKKVYATVDCLDVPGLCFVDEHGRAAARRFLNAIRTADVVVLVVRAFEDPAVPAYRNRVDPGKDLVELKNEILLADLELVATRIDKLHKLIRKPGKTQAQEQAELALHEKLQATIEQEKPISSAIANEAELNMVRSLGFLTLKPMVVVVNVGEKSVQEKFDFAGALDESVPVIALCAKLEYELAQLDPASRTEFMTDLHIEQSAADKFVRSCFSAVGLISFLTVGADEVRAWPIPIGTVAVEAAGKVHTDMKRGFIRAETFSFAELKQAGDEKALRAAGKIRLEGKEYVVQDGDVIKFRFNV
jgi:hypothetical protein